MHAGMSEIRGMTLTILASTVLVFSRSYMTMCDNCVLVSSLLFSCTQRAGFLHVEMAFSVTQNRRKVFVSVSEMGNLTVFIALTCMYFVIVIQ